MPVNDQGRRSDWWIRPIWKVDAEAFEHPAVPLEVITNCERYSPVSGLLESCEITSSKLSGADTEKLTAWRGKQVSLHDARRRSFGHYELKSVESANDRALIILAAQPAINE